MTMEERVSIAAPLVKKDLWWQLEILSKKMFAEVLEKPG